MKLGLTSGGFGKQLKVNTDLIQQAESLGFDSAWTAEAYGNDAVTTATWILAHTTRLKVGTSIMQMPARTPAMTAMTAISLDHLSGGRFILGLGVSGPQVVEGWHGVPYGRPLTRTKEYIEIVRKILAREAPVEYDGYHYQLPNRGPGTTGLGKPLKCILHGNPTLPIYTASISPKGVTNAAEVADGVFPIWMDPEKCDVLQPHLEAGFAKAGNGKSLKDFAVCPMVTVALADDADAARRRLKPNYALYIGGMGARDKNFYNDYAKRLGFEDAAAQIQDHFLAGRREEAVAAVPDAFVDAVALVGPKERIQERLGAWKAAADRGYVDTLLLGTMQPEALDVVAEAVL